ncbi:MAG: carboxymuconolactone decarboxylase family protein [Rhodospirillales bacterium]|nr:carboxymuconolactone decarboxylase family protein [Rhodospirillales bacterium]
MSSGMYEKGLRNRGEVLGQEYVDKAIDGADSFNGEFQRILTTYCWGEIWSGEGLDRKQRSLNNLCMTAASGRSHEFELHFRGAIRNGVSLAALRDTLMQIAVYCGMPAGVESFRIARRVFEELGIDPDADESLR